MSDWATKSYPCLYHTCGNFVAVEGQVCWPCQSYDDYLAGPHCECPHVRGCDCLCDPDDCTGCPELEYLMDLAAYELWLQADGKEPVKGAERAPQAPNP